MCQIIESFTIAGLIKTVRNKTWLLWVKTISDCLLNYRPTVGLSHNRHILCMLKLKAILISFCLYKSTHMGTKTHFATQKLQTGPYICSFDLIIISFIFLTCQKQFYIYFVFHKRSVVTVAWMYEMYEYSLF